MKKYVMEKSIIPETVKMITAEQCKTGIFYNVSVKPYNGKKYDAEKVAVLVIG